MNLEIRYAEHPDDAKHYDTKTLRDHYLLEKVFLKDEINLCYTHSDRVVFGRVFPAQVISTNKNTVAFGRRSKLEYVSIFFFDG
jgi:5-keto 4-deoxyuronate isomerase